MGRVASKRACDGLIAATARPCFAEGAERSEPAARFSRRSFTRSEAGFTIDSARSGRTGCSAAARFLLPRIRQTCGLLTAGATLPLYNEPEPAEYVLKIGNSGKIIRNW